MYSNFESKYALRQAFDAEPRGNFTALIHTHVLPSTPAMERCRSASRTYKPLESSARPAGSHSNSPQVLSGSEPTHNTPPQQQVSPSSNSLKAISKQTETDLKATQSESNLKAAHSPVH